MRSDWKRILYLLILFSLFKCAWVVRTREEFNRFSFDIHPLPESLIILPDYNGDIYKYPIIFQVRWRHSSFHESQSVLNYKVRADGRFEAGDIKLGYLSRVEMQHLIDTLNSIGFFCITEGRLLYEYFDVERIYLFGLLVKTKRQVIQNYPNDVTYHSNFKLRNLHHSSDYYGVEKVTENPEFIKELQILKQGHELMEDFFETKALESIDSCYFSSLHNYQIIPECSLDAKITFAKKTSTWIPLYWERDKGYTVVTKLFVAPDGQVIYGLIEESSGYRYFDYNALYSINKIERYKYTCPLYQGDSVYAWITLPLKSITFAP